MINPIQWPNRGYAFLQLPRGNGNSMYETPEGFRLRNTPYGWQAQFKGFTTHWKPTHQEAIDALEDMIDKAKG
jgi:hypothetical protein